MRCENKIRKWWTLWLLKVPCGRTLVTQIRIEQQKYDFYCWGCGDHTEKPFDVNHPFYKQAPSR